MEINSEIRSRIVDAAAELYDQGNRESLPTVDAVRRAARADMNTTSAVMRDWRRQQTATPAAVAVAVPDRIQEVQAAALAALWSEAQELANESLAAARQAWETERADFEAMRAELAEAYEAQAQEMEAIQQQLAEAQAAQEGLRNELEKSRQSEAGAREHAAGLAGQLEALTAQNRELMGMLQRPEKKAAAPRATAK